MLSLVGDYTDSEDEENPIEADKVTEPCKEKLSDPTQKISHTPSTDSQTPENQQRNLIIDDEDEYFVNPPCAANVDRPSHPDSPSDEDSSSDDSNSHDFHESIRTTSTRDSEKLKPEIQLANPFSSFGSSVAEVSKSDSVFQIEFLEDEQQKSNALQKHVKMTSQPGGNAKINGKKVCWNFRKGKCRFGHNCSYGHDTDLLAKKEISGSGAPGCDSTHSTTQVPKPPSSFTIQREAVRIDPDESYDPSIVITSNKPKEKVKPPSDDDDDMVDDHKSDNLKGKKKRKRPGLVHNLTPGKKIMNAYYKNKSTS